MKEIWINLELYFESYEFSNFRDFLDFLNLFSIFKVLKIIKKRQKGVIFVRDPSGCDVVRKATWQSHADPRERLHGTEVTRVCIFIFTRNIGL